MLRCIRCSSMVTLLKRPTRVWVAILWALLFWPAAIIYAVTRPTDLCPQCLGNVFHPIQSSVTPQGQAAGGPPRTGAPRVLMWAGLGVLLVMMGGCVLAVILVATSEGPETPGHEFPEGREGSAVAGAPSLEGMTQTEYEKLPREHKNRIIVIAPPPAPENIAGS